MTEWDSLPDDHGDHALERREYLYTMGLIAGGIGIATESESVQGAETDLDPDLFSTAIDQDGREVETSRSFVEPVAIAGPLSYNGPEPSHARLREITSDSLELFLEEWTYLDGRHWDETTSCLVIETGSYSLEGGIELAGGTTESNHAWTSVSFPSPFPSTPVVFSDTQTVNGSDPVVTRQKDVSETGFSVRVQEEEAGGDHSRERVGYLAVEPGLGTLDGKPFEAGLQSGVDDEWTSIAFDDTYRDPLLFVDAQTFRGPNTCSIRYRNLGASDVEVKVQEEASKDEETDHTDEQVGYLVIEGDADSGASDGGSDGDVTDGFGVEEFGTGGFGT